MAGRALHRVIEVAIETGYLPKDFTWSDQQQFKYFKREEVVLLCTGSQGEAARGDGADRGLRASRHFAR